MENVEKFLSGRDTINSKSAQVVVNINGEIIPVIQCKKFKATIKKHKEDVQVLGNNWTMKKTTSAEGTGTLGEYTIDSKWIKKGIPFTQEKGDLYFSLTFTVDDPTSAAGKQIIQLDYVNLDEIPIADIEAKDNVMTNECDFTFEGVTLIKPFDGVDAINRSYLQTY
ncbi:hypothetical protein GCM10022297_01100 [Lactobacillus hamsteri]|uniref:Sheath tail protein n=1 Tax=Lactobacillus hamsteri DSM 5661 = JCM 6256 TaxID=1423754 RepID=A0A0R1Y3X9_9LACO|nr:phage tail tube protein [Lactobacillus hamsteri]KRM37000.1 sheath tail protein [Lactobacillus hamsteri DSM 5661 = JCM 6256]